MRAGFFTENITTPFMVPVGFFQVFIIIFPAVTGIMAGTNFSGDLEDPGKSIGFGTLFAIGVALVVYIFLGVLLGATLEKEVMSDQLTAKVVMQNIAYNSSIVVIGLIASTISSALGTCCWHCSFFFGVVYISARILIVDVYFFFFGRLSGALVGSARILQALARDQLVPGISRFGYGSPGKTTATCYCDCCHSTVRLLYCDC